MNKNNEPRLDFISDLETNLTSQLRRHERFGATQSTTGFKNVTKLALVFMLCIATGIAAAKTVDHIETSRRTGLLLIKFQTNIDLIEAQQRVVEELIKEVNYRVEAGISHSNETDSAVMQSDLLAEKLNRARLDLDEVKAAGRSPRDELFAPLQDGRDFVSERLQIEANITITIIDHLEAKVSRLNELVEAGLVHLSEKQHIDMQITHANKQLNDVNNRLSLREAFLSGVLTAKQISIQEMLHEAQKKAETSLRISQSTAANLQKLSEAHENGLASDLDLRQSEYQLMSAQAEHRLAKAELELLEEELLE